MKFEIATIDIDDKADLKAFDMLEDMVWIEYRNRLTLEPEIHEQTKMITLHLPFYYRFWPLVYIAKKRKKSVSVQFLAIKRLFTHKEK